MCVCNAQLYVILRTGIITTSFCVGGLFAVLRTFSRSRTS